ncbi:thioredoxin family protein [Thalassobacillus devorans]|uniref:thioredoxin family protein n=1 Tax=Thalassobacillus devorans TaxID=279813 RepID=UPI0004B65493|nr:thioredoxin family protein [Thalassobacillus devorans]
MEQLELASNSETIPQDKPALLFIHSPFCGTCHMARKMLDTIEAMWGKDLFLELNAAVHPAFMQEYQITSVPCLLILTEGKIKDKIYAFHSVTYMHRAVSKYVNS